jgi:hypothetical protein
MTSRTTEPGAHLIEAIRSGLPAGVELDEREEALLNLAARQARDIARAEADIEGRGYLVEGSTGRHELRVGWDAYGEAIMRDYDYECEGRRPWAWWVFDHGVSRRRWTSSSRGWQKSGNSQPRSWRRFASALTRRGSPCSPAGRGIPRPSLAVAATSS